MTMPLSRGAFVVGPASPTSPHVRIYTLVHLSQASPRILSRTFDSATLPLPLVSVQGL